jgi:hypothetical protein
VTNLISKLIVKQFDEHEKPSNHKLISKFQQIVFVTTTLCREPIKFPNQYCTSIKVERNFQLSILRKVKSIMKFIVVCTFAIILCLAILSCDAGDGKRKRKDKVGSSKRQRGSESKFNFLDSQGINLKDLKKRRGGAAKKGKT